MLNNFKPRNLVPALLYAAASAVDVWFLLVQTAKMQQWHGEAPASLAAVLVFGFTWVIASVCFNFLDNIECGLWHAAGGEWFRGSRGKVVAIGGVAGAAYNIFISLTIAHFVQMTAIATGLEVLSATIFGFWWTALVVCWIVGGPVTAENRQG